MSLYDLPPVCHAFTAGAHDSGARISPGHCRAPGTRRVVAYDLTHPELFAVHTDVTCDEHAPALIAFWHRRGLRRPGKARKYRVIGRHFPFDHSHVGTYPSRLGESLPGSPEPDYGAAYERRGRPEVEVSTVTILVKTGDDGPRPARLDLTPADSGFGLARRAMCVTLATAYNCQSYAAMSHNGPWSDRLGLQVFGDEENVKALHSALPRILAAAHHEARRALTGYRAWLKRRPAGEDMAPGERRTACTAWRRVFLPCFAHQWARLITPGQTVHYVQAPRVDDDEYSAIQAAHHAAYELWAKMRAMPKGARGRAAYVPPPTTRGPRHHGRRTPYLRPLDVQATPPSHQLTLWQPTAPAVDIETPAQAPAPRPEPVGRPLLDVLAEDREQALTPT